MRRRDRVDEPAVAGPDVDHRARGRRLAARRARRPASLVRGPCRRPARAPSTRRSAMARTRAYASLRLTPGSAASACAIVLVVTPSASSARTSRSSISSSARRVPTTVRRRDDERELAARLFARELGREIGRGAAPELLEHLRDLAADAHLPVGAHHREVGEQPVHAVRRFVAHERRAPVGEVAQLPPAAPPTRRGRKPTYTKRSTGRPATLEHREQRRRPGHGRHVEPRFDRALHDDVARVAAQRRPRVAHERDARAVAAAPRAPRRRAPPRCARGDSRPVPAGADQRVARARGSAACPPRPRRRPLRRPAGPAARGRRRCRSAPRRRTARPRRSPRPTSVTVTRSSASRSASTRTSARSTSAALFVASYASVRPRRPGPRRNTRLSSPRKNGVIVARNASRNSPHSNATSTSPRSASSAASSWSLATPSTHVARRVTSRSRVSSSVLSCVPAIPGWPRHVNDTEAGTR